MATPRSINALEVLAAGKTRVCPAAPRPRSPHKSPGSDGNAMPPLGPAVLQYAPPATGTHPGQEPVHPQAAALLRLIGPLHLGVCAPESRVRARVTISQPPNPFNRLYCLSRSETLCLLSPMISLAAGQDLVRGEVPQGLVRPEAIVHRLVLAQQGVVQDQVGGPPPPGRRTLPEKRPVRPLHMSVQPRTSRRQDEQLDPQRLAGPLEVRLELGAAIDRPRPDGKRPCAATTSLRLTTSRAVMCTR